MLKIVEIIPILSIRRGAEIFFANLCVAFKKRSDIDLNVILLYDEIDESFVKQFEQAGIKPFYCHKRKGIDFKASKLFKRIIEQIDPDVIHTHNCCFFTYFFAFRFKKTKWNYFHTCHSVPDIEATKIEHLFRKCFSKKRRITNIGISPIVSNAFKQKYKIDYVPFVLNGIPIVSNTFAKKEYDFIICASFDENKNHRLLIEAFCLLPNVEKLKLICVGGGPLLEKTKELANQKGLSSNIIFTGPVSNVGKFLGASKIFVLPSKNEGIPISILEAMNYGLPIVASRVGGIPDIISDKNGILFTSNSKEELSNALNELINNKDLYDKISKYNMDYVKKFSIEKTAKEYIDIFESKYENNYKQ